MSNEIITYEECNVSFPKCRLTRTALEIDTVVSVDEFLDIWTKLKKLKGVLPWWVDDAYLHAENNQLFTFEKFMAEVRMDYRKGTVRNCVFVCRRLPTSRRRERLSFGHHQAVASLEDERQEYYLDVAEQLNLSVLKLRNHIKEDMAVKPTCEDMYFVKTKSVFLAACQRDMHKLNIKVSNLIGWMEVYRHNLFEFRPDIILRNEIQELITNLPRLLETNTVKPAESDAAVKSDT